MKEQVLDEYEKARRQAYQPLVDRIPPDRRENIFILKLCCGSGWKTLIFNLVEHLDNIWTGYAKKKGKDVWKLLQVKEKFGGLCFILEYPVDPSTDVKARREQSYAAIDFAETEAWKTCERCGAPGHTTSVHFQIATVCDPCEARMKLRSKQGLTPVLFG